MDSNVDVMSGLAPAPLPEPKTKKTFWSADVGCAVWSRIFGDVIMLLERAQFLDPEGTYKWTTVTPAPIGKIVVKAYGKASVIDDLWLRLSGLTED